MKREQIDVCLLQKNYIFGLKEEDVCGNQVKKEFFENNADILIMTAAVADYRPEMVADLKIKKE